MYIEWTLAQCPFSNLPASLSNGTLMKIRLQRQQWLQRKPQKIKGWGACDFAPLPRGSSRASALWQTREGLHAVVGTRTQGWKVTRTPTPPTNIPSCSGAKFLFLTSAPALLHLRMIPEQDMALNNDFIDFWGITIMHFAEAMSEKSRLWMKNHCTSMSVNFLARTKAVITQGYVDWVKEGDGYRRVPAGVGQL